MPGSMPARGRIAARTTLAALAAAVLLAGCGGSSPGGGSTRMDLTLDFFPNADHAGILILTVIAIALFVAVSLAERVLVPWSHEA